MAPLCTEKGSCRWCVERCKLLPRDMCPACERQSKYSSTVLRRLIENGEEQKDGVCQRLHGGSQDQESTEAISRKRTRKKAASSVQANNRIDKAIGPKKKKKRRKSGIALETTLKTLNKISKSGPGILDLASPFGVGKSIRDTRMSLHLNR